MKYLGFEPSQSGSYNFLSYNTEDKGRVARIACELSRQGMSLWYDYGIPYDSKWRGIIAERVDHCQALVLFYTNGILAKEDSYVRKEYRFAREYGKQIFVVLLDELPSLSAVPYEMVDWVDELGDRQLIDGTTGDVNAIAQQVLRSMRENGVGGGSNMDASDLYREGCNFYYGDGVKQDREKAVELFFQAAKLGDSSALYALGTCYKLGLGLPMDCDEAAKWYRRAAEQGNANGQFELGDCYMYGTGVPGNPSEAAKWYRRAAEQGNASGQCGLGRCFFYGKGVPENRAEAVRWFRRAADQGDAYGQCNLGCCYLRGNGVAKDEFEAARLFKKSAGQGHRWGQYYLAKCYEHGKGVARSLTKAVELYRASAAQGNKEARDKLAKLL